MIGDRSEIYSSIDRSHLISGIRNKLHAYKKFLIDQPRYNQICCLIQYLIPFDCLACEDPDCTHFGASEFSTEINRLIREIQEQWPGSLHVIRRNLDREERLILWSHSKYLLITTLRDGQCIPPLEFIAVKSHQKKFRTSAIIISEFSGNSKALGGVIKINPSNSDEITKAIDTVIQMSELEKQERL